VIVGRRGGRARSLRIDSKDFIGAGKKRQRMSVGRPVLAVHRSCA